MRYQCSFLICLAMMCIGLSAHGQGHCSDARGFSTNPANPINPDGPCGVPNTFDWRKGTHNVLGVAFPVPTPYTTHPHFNDPTLSSYIDSEPADGWELIKAGEEHLPSQEVNYGYFILYNKQGSFLRIFFTLNPLEAAQAISTSLIFSSDNISGLLHPNRGFSQAMDQLSVEVAMASVRANNQFGNFIYVDIPVEYDPCTCSKAATLKFEFKNVLNQRVDLVGRFWELERTLSEINDGQIGIFDDDYLLNVLQSNSLEEVLGTQTFANIEALIEYHGQLKDEHAELKIKHEKILAFEGALKFLSLAGGPILKSIKVIKDATLFNIPNTTFSYSGADILQGMMGGLNYYSARTKRDLDSASGKLNRVGGTSVSNGEMAFKGNIETVTAIGGEPSFALPGSAGTGICGATSVLDYNNRFNRYPRYNEILGRFALLETPVVELQTGLLTGPAIGYDRFRIDPGSIKYVFNPAARIDEGGTDIYAALRITYPNYNPASPFYSNNAPPGNVPFGPGIQTAFQTFGVGADNLIDVTVLPGLPDGAVPHTFYEEFPGVFITPMVPLSCIGEFVGANSYWLNGVPDRQQVELVLAVDFGFQPYVPGGEGARAIQIYSYPVEVQRTVQNMSAMPASPSPTPAYPTSLTLATTHYTQSQTIFAWGDITISGTLTTAPGVRVEIIAPDITVLDGARIGEDIWLRNGETPFGECAPLMPVSQAEVAAFCGDASRYKANQSLDQPDEEGTVADLGTGLEVLEPAGTGSLFSVQVEPNPASNYAVLRVALPEGGDLSAHLSDLNGQVVAQLGQWGALPPGEHLFDAPMQGLSAGMYILTVRSAAGVRSVKVVKR